MVKYCVVIILILEVTIKYEKKYYFIVMVILMLSFTGCSKPKTNIKKYHCLTTVIWKELNYEVQLIVA